MDSTRSNEPPISLVLAGGLGTRLRPLTDRVPKCLVEIGGFPLLEGWHAALAAAGFDRAIVNAHAHAAQVEAWAQEASDRGPVQWTVFHEPELLGSAGTLRAVLPQLERGRDFLVIYGDNLSEVDLGAFLAFHRDGGHEFTIALYEVPDPESKGVVELDANDRVVSFEEKPERPRSNLVNAGLYAISRGVLGSIDWSEAFDLGHDVLPLLISRMAGYRLHGYHRDIGTPESLESAERDLREGRLVWPRAGRPNGGKP
mgnify:CR=1 FL=1